MAYRLISNDINVCDSQELLSLLLYVATHKGEDFEIIPNVKTRDFESVLVKFPKRGSRSDFVALYGPENYNHLKLSTILVEKLKKAGYTLLEICLYKKERPIFNFKGHGVEFGFSLPGCDESPYLDGKMAVDRIGYFDKYSKCPVFIPLPSTEEEFQYAIGILRDYKNFDYDNQPLTAQYPRSLHKKSRTYLC